jgi:hypothetical protein
MKIAKNRVVKRLLIPVASLVILSLTAFIFLGYLSSSIGYYGYNKDKYRRYSRSKKESLQREVFIKELNFEVESVNVDAVFIEKAFKWGDSSKETELLKLSDTVYEENYPNSPYQIIIDYQKVQKNYNVFIPDNSIVLNKSSLEDTIKTEVYIRDSRHNLLKKEVLKIW